MTPTDHTPPALLEAHTLTARLETLRRTRKARGASRDEVDLLDELARDLRPPHHPDETAQALRDVLSGLPADPRPQTLIGVPPALLDRAVSALEGHWADAERYRARLNQVLFRQDHLESVANRKIGLRRELEQELFGEALPLAADGGEAAYLRGLAAIRDLKAKAGALEGLALAWEAEGALLRARETDRNGAWLDSECKATYEALNGCAQAARAALAAAPEGGN